MLHHYNYIAHSWHPKGKCSKRRLGKRERLADLRISLIYCTSRGGVNEKASRKTHGYKSDLGGGGGEEEVEILF